MSFSQLSKQLFLALTAFVNMVCDLTLSYLVVLDVSQNLLRFCCDTSLEGLNSIRIGLFQLGLQSGH